MREARAAIVLCVGLLLVFAARSKAEERGENHETISVGGKKRRAVIVYGKDQGGHEANTLARYMKAITGRQAPVTSDLRKALPEEFRIHVGRDEYVNSLGLDFESLHPVGYYIKLADQNNLVIAGKTGMGTAYAIFDFLKRHAGYRLFGPGPAELCEIVPTKEVIELPAAINLREEPSFITYMFGGNGHFGRDCHVNVQATHNLEEIYPPKKYAQTHPEYYPMFDGNRSKWDPEKKVLVGPTMGWQPCVSNPDLPGIAVEFARGFFAKNPQALGLSLGVNDGGGDCECPECLKLKEKYKNPYVPFANEVARRFQKEFPGKLVGFITYASAGPPPESITLEPNVYVEIMHGGFPGDFRRIKEWCARGAKRTGMYGWVYGSFNSGYVVPRYYPHVLGNAWKKAHREYGLQGAWLETDGTWLYEGARHYVLSELAWNINADTDRLLDDYFSHLYAEAARPARQFFDRIEEIYARKPDPLAFAADCFWTGGDPLDQFAEYTWDDLAYLDGRLKEARAAAKDEKAARRAALLDKLFGFSRPHIEGYLALRLLREIREVKGQDEGARIVDALAKGLKALREIEGYTMTEEEQKLIFGDQGPKKFEDIRRGGGRGIRVAIEREADRVFDQITACLMGGGGDWKKARDFWVKTAAGTQEEILRALALTQVYIRESPEAKVNLIRNPGCEPSEKQRDGLKGERKRHPWKEQHPEGWDHWGFAVADFYWDGTEAHGGEYSVCTGRHRSEGAFVFHLPVVPGCRYRVSCWVKQDPPGKGGELLIDMGGVGKNRIKVPYPREKESRWRRVETTFSGAEGVKGCTLMFYAPPQKDGEFTWFDDAEIVKVCDPAHFRK